MSANKELIENNGNIKISDEVIATIASVAVAETKGVYGLASSIAGEIASKFSKKPAMNKGIRVTADEKEASLDISLIMNYGVRIPEVAWEIQENVKKSVESMSGLEVIKVNIHVAGVNFEAEKEEPEIESAE